MAPRRDRLKAKAETSRASPSAELTQLNKVTAAIPAGEARGDRRADEPPSVLPPEPPLLSRTESQRIRTVYEEVMVRNAGQKTGPEDEDSKTRSSNTSARNYRQGNLEQVNVLLHAEPPGDVEATIKGIVNAKAPDRRAKLQEIAQDMYKQFLEQVALRALEPLYRDNLRIHYDETWNRALKPVAQSQIKVNVSTPPANDSQDLSTENPRSDDCSPVRTPCPDISMGISKKALICALSLQGLGMGDATKVIKYLETEMVQDEPDRPFGPLLPLDPSKFSPGLTFPFVVIEGKSYCDDRQIFDAENQAAGAMACAHNLLLHLDRRANGYSQPRVLFSFTTQGPIIELWTHWTDVKYGMRTFESKLWDSWNVLNPERADDFIEKLNAVCDWGTGQFMESVVEQLRKIADGSPVIKATPQAAAKPAQASAKPAQAAAKAATSSANPAQSTRRNRKGAEAEDAAQAGVGRF